MSKRDMVSGTRYPLDAGVHQPVVGSAINEPAAAAKPAEDAVRHYSYPTPVDVHHWDLAGWHDFIIYVARNTNEIEHNKNPDTMQQTDIQTRHVTFIKQFRRHSLGNNSHSKLFFPGSNDTVHKCDDRATEDNCDKTEINESSHQCSRH